MHEQWKSWVPKKEAAARIKPINSGDAHFGLVAFSVNLPVAYGVELCSQLIFAWKAYPGITRCGGVERNTREYRLYTEA